MIIIISLLLSAFFSGMEIAFLTSNKLKIEINKKQNSIASKAALLFTRNPNLYITSILIGNNIMLVIFSLFISDLLLPHINPYITSELWIIIIKTIISTFIILIIGEFVPKILFRLYPNFLFNLFIIPIFIFYIIFYPITKVVTVITNYFLNKVFKIDIPNKKEYIFSRYDLDALVNLGIENKHTENLKEIEFVKNALDFSETRVKDCMKPRKEIAAIDISASYDDLKKIFIETGYSKILVYKQSIDNIIGYVSLKDLFDKPGSIRSKLLKCLFVPETMSAYKLLNTFLLEKKNIAVVVDEFGGTSGIITIEDIIEEIFGEIDDEHDTVELIEKQISKNEYILSGRHEIDYLNEKYNFEIPENEEYDTLAGYILFYYQSLPKVNDIITIDKFEFLILRIIETRIDLVNLKIIK